MEVVLCLTHVAGVKGNKNVVDRCYTNAKGPYIVLNDYYCVKAVELVLMNIKKEGETKVYDLLNNLNRRVVSIILCVIGILLLILGSKTGIYFFTVMGMGVGIPAFVYYMWVKSGDDQKKG